jgi:hypothetical protein
LEGDVIMELTNGRRIVSILSVCVLMAVPALSQYEISWYTIDGGGGASSGGPYVLTGAIGQPDADWASGGAYELLGGFWPGGPLCVVEFDDFTRLAQLWLNTGSGLAGDLDGDNDVDFDDLSWLADFWLCNCPGDWQLK